MDRSITKRRSYVGLHRNWLSIGVSMLAATAALSGWSPAMAQSRADQAAAEADDESGEEVIVVTGSLIDKPGFEAPTPTTVIGEVELRQASKNNAAEVLADIPQFRFSNNPSTNQGLNSIGSAGGDLRALGGARTLNLVNGHRFAGDADLNSIPFGAIKRIDVVTGGASATYGSGAVAGVINIILKDDLNGLAVTAQSGISSRGDGAQYRFDITGGTDFSEGRGNILISAEYFKDEGILSQFARENVGGFQLIGNPGFTPANGQTRRLLLPDIHFNQFSKGGLVINGPFAGQQFLPGGALAPFNKGSIDAGRFGFGGEGPQVSESFALRSPLERQNAVAAITYALTDSIRLSADFRYANVESGSTVVTDQSVSTIKIDNAFLSADARSRLVAAGATTFRLARFNNDIGFNTSDVKRESYQGTIGLDGDLGQTFRWDVYYTHGELLRDEAFINLILNTAFDQAIDSVIDTRAGSATAGQPICRVALTDPATRCVPLNPFGEGSPSAAAGAFVFGTSSSHVKDTLDVVAGTLRGEPFSLWAGPVSVAIGAEWRKEKAVGTVDPLSAMRAFRNFQFDPFAPAQISVKEGFGEILLPLVKDVPLLRLLEFNGAARYSDYSTEGGIWSWKLGLINELFDGLRVRAVRSRDIRAPNLREAFGPGGLITTSLIDPFLNLSAAAIIRTGGNSGLVSEKADTTTAGIVFEPSFISGLSISADYYTIDVDGAISNIGAQEIINRCFANQSNPLCNQITRDPPAPGQTIGPITQVRAQLINLARFKTSGVDFELSYRTSLAGLISSAPGRMNFRVLANYVDELIFDDGKLSRDFAGDVGGAGGFSGGGGGGSSPHWRGIAGATYDDGRFTADLRARYVGGGEFDSFLPTSCDPIGRTAICPDIKARVYVDLGLQYGTPLHGDDGPRLTVFGRVANLFDRDPPVLPNARLYDVVGRYFTAGARINF